MQRATIVAATCRVGLVLSAFGLFGVISHGVRQRTRELGVRLALGARRGDIAAIVLGQALRLAGIGLAIGLVLSFAATQLIESALFGVTAGDPWTLCVVSVLLAGVALAAAYLPARWAMNVDPLVSIRAE